MTDTVGASIVSGSVRKLKESLDRFSDSSDALGKKMVVIMVLQLFVAGVQLLVAVAQLIIAFKHP